LSGVGREGSLAPPALVRWYAVWVKVGMASHRWSFGIIEKSIRVVWGAIIAGLVSDRGVASRSEE
jgi:hypothetical protein